MTRNKVPESESLPSIGGTQDPTKLPQDSKTSHAFRSRLKGSIEFLGEHSFVTGVLALVGAFGLGLSAVGYLIDRGEAEETSEQLEQMGESLAAVASELEEQRGYIRNAATTFLQTKMQLDDHHLSDEEIWGKALGKVADDTGIPLLDLQSGIALFIGAVSQNENASKMDMALAQFAMGEFDSAGDLAFLAAEEAEQKEVAAERLIEQISEARKSAQAEQRQAFSMAGQSRSAGRRYLEAVAAFKLALEVNADLREEEPFEWASLQVRLGDAAEGCGRASEGQEIHKWFQFSVDAYRQSLEVRTRESLPHDWAASQNNIGFSLWRQASPLSGAIRTRLLEESVSAYRQAFEVYTRESFPQHWAMNQNHIGLSLWSQAQDASGTARARLFGEALSAFRQSLEVRTRESFPRQWAASQSDIGATLRYQADAVSGAARARLLEESVSALRQSLEVRTRESLPHGWALSQRNLGSALWRQADAASGAARASLLEESVFAYRQSLEIYTRESLPQKWAASQGGLGRALRDQAGTVSGAARVHLLEESVFAYRQALEVWTEELEPQRFSEGQSWLEEVNNEIQAADVVAEATDDPETVTD